MPPETNLQDESTQEKVDDLNDKKESFDNETVNKDTETVGTKIDNIISKINENSGVDLISIISIGILL